MISTHQPKRGFASVFVKETEREEEREKRGRRSRRTRILEEKALSGDVLTAQEKIRMLAFLVYINKSFVCFGGSKNTRIFLPLTKKKQKNTQKVFRANSETKISLLLSGIVCNYE